MHKLFPAFFFIILMMSQHALAADNSAVDIEINLLLNAVEESQCVFNRNGTDYSASEAKSHLQLKYRKGKKYVKTTEHFIDRLATASSWTGKKYTITCPNQQTISSGEWLHNKLKELRKQSH
jgi:hypothetical protein